MKNDLQTTSWDNSNIYNGFKDPQILKDVQHVETKIDYLKSKTPLFTQLVPLLESKFPAELEETIPLAREVYRLDLDLSILLYTLGTYASTAASVDSFHYEAKDLYNNVLQLIANLNKTTKPLHIFLQRVPTSYVDQFLNDESVNEAAFSLHYAAKQKDFLLSIPEEVLLEGHAVDGFDAWAKLYTDISGGLKVHVQDEEMGLAQASNILFLDDSKKREVAYYAINKAWEQNETSAAAILNSIFGWRLENNRARSAKRELHYLDTTCHQQKITRKTLDTLMQTTYEHRNIGHDALKLMAQEIGLKKLGPWDILAPYPSKTSIQKISFPEAMEIIYDAFGKFSPEMADFARHAYKMRWIDATPTPNRKPGAYCTSFANNREPRVFITYDGSMKNVITLAHELGHAYHNWVMKDLMFGQISYPSTLAETASIFAETLVRDAILQNSKTIEDKKAILWQEIESAASLLINIPARYEFELQFMELRKTKTLSIPEIKQLSNKAWEYWYGDTLTNYNEMFWASKLHFSMSKRSFYNYPYLFGYLFSLGIYAKKDEGDQFKELYVNILRDTGRMTAEDLIMKYLKDDISQKNFWEKSLRIVENSVNAYKNL